MPNPANYPQSDPCAKINAAIGALPAAGGTVDGRGFAPGETCNATLEINKPVTLLFGAGNWTFNGSPGINITAPNVVIACPAAASLETSPTTLISGAAAPLIANFADAEVNNGNYHTADATQILDCALNGNNLGTFGIFAPAVYSMKIRGVHASAFTAANILAIAGQNDMYNTVSDSSAVTASSGAPTAASPAYRNRITTPPTAGTSSPAAMFSKLPQRGTTNFMACTSTVTRAATGSPRTPISSPRSFCPPPIIPVPTPTTPSRSAPPVRRVRLSSANPSAAPPLTAASPGSTLATPISTVSARPNSRSALRTSTRRTSPIELRQQLRRLGQYLHRRHLSPACHADLAAWRQAA